MTEVAQPRAKRSLGERIRRRLYRFSFTRQKLSTRNLDQLCREAIAEKGGRFESGELAIREEAGARAVPTSLFTRWCGDDIEV